MTWEQGPTGCLHLRHQPHQVRRWPGAAVVSDKLGPQVRVGACLRGRAKSRALAPPGFPLGVRLWFQQLEEQAGCGRGSWREAAASSEGRGLTLQVMGLTDG